MKIFYSLNQRLEAWRRRNNNRRHPLFSNETSSSEKSSPRDKPSSAKPLHLYRNGPWQTPFMLLVSVASLTSVVGYRFYNQPQLDVGTISPETIIAPHSGKAVDEETTELRRKDARTGIGVIPVLKRDPNITEQTLRELENFLEQVEQLRTLTGTFPFVQEQLLSVVTQRYLRRAPESEWKTILAALNPEFPPSPEPSVPTANPMAQKTIDSAMEQAVGELYGYRQKLGEESFRNLLQKLVNIRQGYTEAQKSIIQQPVISLRTEYILTMLELRDEVWVEMKKGITQATQRILTQGISPGLPENLLKDSVKTQLYFTVPAKTEPVANALLLKILRPNLIEDPEKTQQKALRQAEEMQPVMVEIKQGEVIVHAGEEITQEDFVLLDYLGLSRRRISWEALVLCGAFVTTSVGVFWVIKRQLRIKLRRRDLILLWLFSLSAPLLEVFKIPYTSLPAIGFLAGSFYGGGLAVTLITILTGLVTFSSGILSWEFLLAGSAGLDSGYANLGFDIAHPGQNDVHGLQCHGECFEGRHTVGHGGIVLKRPLETLTNIGIVHFSFTSTCSVAEEETRGFNGRLTDGLCLVGKTGKQSLRGFVKELIEIRLANVWALEQILDNPTDATTGGTAHTLQQDNCQSKEPILQDGAGDFHTLGSHGKNEFLDCLDRFLGIDRYFCHKRTIQEMNQSRRKDLIGIFDRAIVVMIRKIHTFHLGLEFDLVDFAVNRLHAGFYRQ